MLSTDEETVEVEGEVVAETAAAVLLKIEGVPGTNKPIECWVPKSQMDCLERDGDMLFCVIPLWLAVQKGLV